MPVGIDIEAMGLPEIEAEVRSYAPSSGSAVAQSEEHRERRVRLWRRLDRLLGVWEPAIASPVAELPEGLPPF